MAALRRLVVASALLFLLIKCFISIVHAQFLQLPLLPYDYNALEPYINEATMKLHHLGHHASYTKKLNEILMKLRADPKTKELAKSGIDSLIQNLEKVPEDYRSEIQNFGGGFLNHEIFWSILSPSGGGEPDGLLEKDIKKTFGSFDLFQKEFVAAASRIFGSGWTWLIYSTKEDKLQIITTQNQDHPLMKSKDIPLLALDVWEHAYYLQYNNDRNTYIQAFWNIVNWKEVARRYNEIATKSSFIHDEV